jgi:hypothetical protein|tara:strand:+ start:3555 stop:4319 length:765 start_codon:yes stop_codon:yes gene_type:complete
MNRVTLTNTIPCTITAIVGDNDPDNKEILSVEPYSFNISWTMFASITDDDDILALSIKQNVAYQKIEHLLRAYLHNSLWYNSYNSDTIESHFSSTQNVLIVTPDTNVMYLSNCLFAKFNAICEDGITVNKVEVQDCNTGIKYTVEDSEGELPEILPVQLEFMGELSMYEHPWWDRADISTYDNRALSEDELTLIKTNLENNRELLEQDWKLIEDDVREYMTDTSEGLDDAEIIELDFAKRKEKKTTGWTPKIVK